MRHSSSLRFARSLRTASAASVCVALATLVGCNEPGNSSPNFRLNTQNEDADRYNSSVGDAEQIKLKETVYIPGRQYIADALVAMFGTPDQPYVFRESGLDLKKIRMASGPVGGLHPDVVHAETMALVEKLKAKQGELEKLQTAAKDSAAKAVAADSAVKAAQPKLTAARTAKNDAEVAAIEKELAVHKPVLDAKAADAAAVTLQQNEIADLEFQIKSYGVEQKGLYRQHCAHCHGTTGDGAGPTALFLTPYPRDYRQGKFKFKATERDAKPTDEDLRRILVDGIPDTAMPTVGLLPSDEIDALVEYVKYLSIRGQVEQALKDKIAADEKVPNSATDGGRAMLVSEILQPIVEDWAAAKEKVIVPTAGSYKKWEDEEKWRLAGQELFLGNTAKCYSCHGVTGLGDGRKASEPLFDDWNKDKKFAANRAAIAAANEAGKTEEATRLTHIMESWDLPEQQQKPRNLRLNRLRFGRAPIDIYRRIYAGINGTEMPGAGKPGAPNNPEKKLTEEQYWQLVDFVLGMPYYQEHGKLPSASGEQKAAPAGHAMHGAADGSAKVAASGSE
ncbi:MAG: c-type cytochrome [Planctomycetales bacterium]|nr:c-type cytochrome [Planctomycetales bacterium]